MPEPTELYLHRLVEWAKDGLATLFLVMGVTTLFAVIVVFGLTGEFPVTLTVVGVLVMVSALAVHNTEVPQPVLGRRTSADDAQA